VLQLSEIHKSYDGKTSIIQKLNLKVEQGEFVCLVGPSGCGKSTLLRLIAGLEGLSSGSIHIRNQNVSQSHPASRDVAMVFQDYALYPHMTVEQNLTFGLRMKKVAQSIVEERLKNTSKMLEISHLLDRKPSQLSGGQRQRVAIGRAVMKQPSLFLFDEPLSNLDAQLRSQTRIEITNLHRKLGATSVYVTHDQVEAMTMADKIVVLNKGEIQQVGSPLELYHRPQNKFVAGFIGNPSMNFVQGKLTKISTSNYKFESEFLSLELLENQMPKQALNFLAQNSKSEFDVYFGFRPESIKILAKKGRESEGNVDAQLSVVQVEPHGHEVHLVAKISSRVSQVQNGNLVVVRSANPHRVEVMIAAKHGEVLNATFDKNALHWFECANNQSRLTH
jgi:multiple sugar transport system ATP-binding protein